MIYVAETDKRTQELLPIYLYTVGMRHTQEYIDRTTDSPCYHFMYVEEGEGVYIFPEKCVEVSKGCVVFLRKNYPVIYKPKGNVFVTAWVTFDGSVVDSLLKYLQVGNYAFFESEVSWMIMQNIYKLACNGTPNEILSKHVYELIVTFFSEMNKSTTSPLLVQAKAYIKKNYQSDISVSDIAGALGVSESLIFRLFHNEFMMTPVEYLRDVRIENAKRLLTQNPDMKVMEVATKCGFSDAAYFCKVFRNQTSMTPKAYKKLHFY